MALRVIIHRPDNTRGYDVTDRIEALQWSNVNPGGHERATFTLKGAWGSGFPEVRRGNIVRIEDGPRELFTGRIDEQDPQVADAEQVSVTAYGLGIRMKDDTMREIYVDRDMTRWRGPSVARKLAAASGGIDVTDMATAPDTTNGQNAINLTLAGPWSRTANVEGVYDSQGIPIGSVYHSWKVNANISPGDANWSWTLALFDNDTPSGASNSSGDLSTASSGTGTVTAGTQTRVFVYLDLTYGVGPAGGNNNQYSLFWVVLAVYGQHGLTKRGPADASHAQGFFASDIVGDVCSRLNSAGIKARQIDTSSFVIQHLTFLDDTTHEDVITAASKFNDVDWGVWGADQYTGEFSDPTIGYLDWTARDSSKITWTAFRDECDECDLHTEIGSTYDQVAVSYSDPTGQTHRELRTIASPALEDAGIATRTAPLQGGTLTKSGAQQLGDAFLALAAGQPVSRGQATIKGSIRNGSTLLPAHFMRADGSNLLIPDAFPDRDVFALHQVNAAQAPQPDNPSADVDTTGWSGNFGTTSVTRDTTNFDTGPASFLVTVGSPGQQGQGSQVTISGTFRAGVTYKLSAMVKTATAVAMRVYFGDTGGVDFGETFFTGSTAFTAVQTEWTPATDVTDAIIAVEQWTTGTRSFNVDSLAITTSQPTADRRSIFPIKRVSVDAGGDEPVTTVELDQTHDLLSILLARLQVATGLVLGGAG